MHSFDGPVDEMHELCALGLYIGINGCSLRSEENLLMVAQIPQDRLLLGECVLMSIYVYSLCVYVYVCMYVCIEQTVAR